MRSPITSIKLVEVAGEDFIFYEVSPCVASPPLKHQIQGHAATSVELPRSHLLGDLQRFVWVIIRLLGE